VSRRTIVWQESLKTRLLASDSQPASDAIWNGWSSQYEPYLMGLRRWREAAPNYSGIFGIQGLPEFGVVLCLRCWWVAADGLLDGVGKGIALAFYRAGREVGGGRVVRNSVG